MYFVIGGAFHGKKQWVKNSFHLPETSLRWINCYKDQLNFSNLDEIETLVIEGVDELIVSFINENKSLPLEFEHFFSKLFLWENETKKRRLIVIGTDRSKGVVPIEKKERIYRDEIGRCFQFLSRHASHVSLIWYGLEQKLKNRGGY